MKSYRKELWMNTSTRRAYLNITPRSMNAWRNPVLKTAAFVQRDAYYRLGFYQ